MPALPPAAGPGGPSFEVDFNGQTHPGKVRPNNEDHFHIVHFGRYLRTVMYCQTAGEAGGDAGRAGHGYVVPAGVGGRGGGEEASRMAIRLLVEFVLQTPDWILSGDELQLTTVLDRFSLRFRAINFAVLAR